MYPEKIRAPKPAYTASNVRERGKKSVTMPVKKKTRRAANR
jgi:hypothetical protein